MMKRTFGAILILMLLFSLLPSVAMAQTPEVGSPADNACNEGGSMAGKCDSEWEWDCGYYLARWLSAGGWAGTYRLPVWCEVLLPPRPLIEAPIIASSSPAFPVAFCVQIAGAYYNFNGGFVAGGSQFVDALCTNPGAAAFNSDLVYSPAPFDPNALCILAGRPGVNVILAPDIYLCQP